MDPKGIEALELYNYLKNPMFGLVDVYINTYNTMDSDLNKIGCNWKFKQWARDLVGGREW